MHIIIVSALVQPRRKSWPASKGERRDSSWRTVLRQAVKARIWFTLDLEKASEAAGATRDRVVSTCKYLEEQGLLTLKAEGVRNRYRRRRISADLVEFARNPASADSGAGSARDWPTAAGAGVGGTRWLSRVTSGRTFWRTTREAVWTLLLVSERASSGRDSLASRTDHRSGVARPRRRAVPRAFPTLRRPAPWLAFCAA